MVVVEVLREGPAEQAGLIGGDNEVQLGNRLLVLGGDVITAIDEQVVKDMYDLMAYLEMNTSVGQSVKIKVRRGKEEKVLTITLGERPVE